jgi:hypothetical protein
MPALESRNVVADVETGSYVENGIVTTNVVSPAADHNSATRAFRHTSIKKRGVHEDAPF